MSQPESLGMAWDGAFQLHQRLSSSIGTGEAQIRSWIPWVGKPIHLRLFEGIVLGGYRYRVSSRCWSVKLRLRWFPERETQWLLRQIYRVVLSLPSCVLGQRSSKTQDQDFLCQHWVLVILGPHMGQTHQWSSWWYPLLPSYKVLWCLSFHILQVKSWYNTQRIWVQIPCGFFLRNLYLWHMGKWKQQSRFIQP